MENKKKEVKTEDVKPQEVIPVETHEMVIDEETRAKVNSVFALIDKKEAELLNTDNVQQMSESVAQEKIKSDLAEEAVRIEAKNQELAEQKFATETKELRLKQLKEALALKHAYEMKTIKDNEKHRIMLDKRQKLVEKYGYLYEQQTYEDVDENGNKITKSRPKNFSYSIIGNSIRTFTRNLQSLDTTVRKIIKWVFFIGVGFAVVWVLKHYGIIV